MKKILCFLCLVMILFMGSVSFAEENEAYEYDFYTVTEKKLVYQTSENAVISFDITNNTSKYYPQLFAVPTLKVSSEKNYGMYFDYIEYEGEEFSLAPNETKTLTIKCEIPEEFPNKSALISVSFYATTHRISIESEDFYLMPIKPTFGGYMEGEFLSFWELHDGYYAEAGTGPNVEADKLPKMRIVLTSTFEEEKTIYPEYTLYERLPVYNNKPLKTSFERGIVIGPGEEKELLLEVPDVTVPESYLLRVFFSDENGRQVSDLYSYRYVLIGDSAKVTKITFEGLNNENLVTAYLYGPADGSVLEDLDVRFSVYDKNNNLIKEYSKTTDLGPVVTKVETKLDTLPSEKAYVKVEVYKGEKKLASKTEELNFNEYYAETKTPFIDIEGRKCEEAVKLLNSLGIINGYSDKTFLPDNLITRAEFSTILAKLNELEIVNVEDRFTDISGHWASDYINSSFEKEYVSGYPDGTFKPQNNVTYQESLAMILNSLGYKEMVNSTGLSWPNNYIETAKKVGLIRDLEIADYGVPANREDIAILTLYGYLLKL